jgi:hypothetical protein
MIERFTEFDPSSGCVRDLYMSTAPDMVMHCEARKTAFMSGHAPRNCLYVKHTENGWEFDPDRLPEPPEPGCVWEHPRWVMLAEQRARYNAALQAQINQVEASQPRALRQLEIARARPTTVAELKDAVDRLIDIESRVAALRAQWWDVDMAAPPGMKIKYFRETAL